VSTQWKLFTLVDNIGRSPLRGGLSPNSRSESRGFTPRHTIQADRKMRSVLPHSQGSLAKRHRFFYKLVRCARDGRMFSPNEEAKCDDTIIRASALALLVSVLPVIEDAGNLPGQRQQIAVRTTPPGAMASLAGGTHDTPGAVPFVEISREDGCSAARNNPAYRPACQLVGGQRRLASLSWTPLPARRPLLIALAPLVLHPCEPTRTRYTSRYILCRGGQPKPVPQTKKCLRRGAWAK